MIELDVDCCGIAGTYGLKKEKYEIAMAVGERLFSDIAATGSDLAACDSETCRWQIAHGAGVTAVHPIELLYRAYGLDGMPQPGPVTAGRQSATVSA
jgi:glycerol-3-phosphate dehydrogenase subunit C